MKNLRLVLCAVFSVILIFCAVAKGTENDVEIVLNGEQKQAYITTQMEKIFHPSGVAKNFQASQGGL